MVFSLGLTAICGAFSHKKMIPELCCNCGTDKFVIEPSGWRQCCCGLRWLNGIERPDIVMKFEDLQPKKK